MCQRILWVLIHYHTELRASKKKCEAMETQISQPDIPFPFYEVLEFGLRPLTLVGSDSNNKFFARLL